MSAVLIRLPDQQAPLPYLLIYTPLITVLPDTYHHTEQFAWVLRMQTDTHHHTEAVWWVLRMQTDIHHHTEQILAPNMNIKIKLWHLTFWAWVITLCICFISVFSSISKYDILLHRKTESHPDQWILVIKPLSLLLYTAVFMLSLCFIFSRYSVNCLKLLSWFFIYFNNANLYISCFSIFFLVVKVKSFQHTREAFYCLMLRLLHPFKDFLSWREIVQWLRTNTDFVKGLTTVPNTISSGSQPLTTLAPGDLVLYSNLYLR